MREISEGYKITIQTSGETGKPPIIVESFIPEEIQLGYQAEFDQPFQQVGRLLSSLGMGLAGYSSGKSTAAKIMGAAIGAGLPTLVASAMGSGMTAPVLTAKLWQSTSGSEITLPLYFEAEYDPITEIRKPIMDLLSLVIPTTNALGILQSPASYVDFSKVGAEVKRDMKVASTVASQYAESQMGSLLSGLNSMYEKAQQIDISGTVNQAKDSLSSASSKLNATDAISSLKSASDSIIGTLSSAASKGSEFARAITSANALKPYLNKIISVRIGTYLEFPCVVIHSVVPTFTSQIDYYSGWPMAARVDITFSSMFTSTQEDMQTIFNSIPQQMAASSAQGFANNSLFGKIGSVVSDSVNGVVNSGIKSGSEFLSSQTNSLLERTGISSLASKIDNL